MILTSENNWIIAFHFLYHYRLLKKQILDKTISPVELHQLNICEL